MKQNRIVLLFAIAISFIITGCPVSSSYPLAESSSALPFDKNLTGTWENNKEDAEVKKIKIEKGSEANTYNVKVQETGELYAAETKNFIGWQVALKGKKFLVLMETGENASKDMPYYVYALSLNRNLLTTYEISLLENGTDAITSIKNYQDEVISSMKKEGFLSEKTEWKRK
ncbi:MAG: hypothetical protein WBC06_14520 [Chitinophagaceae bacterium]